MTKEEAISILTDIRFDSNTRVNGESFRGKACMMGIEALKEQKKGKWIVEADGMVTRCSECQSTITGIIFAKSGDTAITAAQRWRRGNETTGRNKKRQKADVPEGINISSALRESSHAGRNHHPEQRSQRYLRDG